MQTIDSVCFGEVLSYQRYYLCQCLKLRQFTQKSQQFMSLTSQWQDQSSKDDRHQCKNSQYSNGNSKINLLLQLKTYQPEQNAPSLLLYHLIQLLFPTTIVLTFLQLESQQGTNGIVSQWISSQLTTETGLVIAAVGIIVKLTLVGVIIIENQKENEQSWLRLMSQLTRIFMQKLRFLIEIEFQLASLLLLTQSIFSLVGFILSSCLILFLTVFMENYSAGKDIFHSKSMLYLTILRLSMILGSIMNFICLRSSGSSSESVLLGVHMLVSLILLYFYFKIGYLTYRNQLLKWLLINYLSVYFSLSLNLILTQIEFYVFGDISSFFLNALITYPIMLLIFYCLFLHWKQNFTQGRIQNIEMENYFLDLLIDSSHEEVVYRGTLSGLLQSHLIRGCTNKDCFIYRDYIYDSKQRRNCDTTSYVQQATSLIKFYMKCRFEHHLAEHSSDIQAYIQFSQFLFVRLKNVQLSYFWLSKIAGRDMNISQKLRVARFKEILSNYCQTFSQQLYHNKLDFQSIISAQITYQRISSQMIQLLEDKAAVWNYLSQHQIDLSVLCLKLLPTFEKVELITEQWRSIAKYFRVQKRWKFEYLCFVLYLKNQKLKSRNIEEFGINPKEKDIFKTQVMNFQRDQPLNKICNSQILFEANSCSLHAWIKNNKLVVRKSSQHFQDLMGYTRQELVDADLNKLLPGTVSKFHNCLFNNWSTQGKSADESTYKVKHVYGVDKSSYLVPFFKFIKQYPNSQGDLQYICFLKKNAKRELSILCNSYFQIEGVTKDFFQQLNIEEDEVSWLKCLNLLSFIPTLAGNSIFAAFMNDTSDIHEQSSIQTSSFRASTIKMMKQSLSSQEQSVVSRIDLSTKIIQDSEIQTDIFYSRNLADLADIYFNQKNSLKPQDLKGYYHAIKTINQIMLANDRSINCKLSLQKIEIGKTFYYHINIIKVNNQKHQAGQEEEEMTDQNDMHLRQSAHFQREFTAVNAQSTMSLAHTSNLFIKEDANIAPKENFYLVCLETIVRIVMIGILLVGSLKIILSNQTYNGVLDNGLLMNNTVFFIKIPYALANIYYSRILNLGESNQTLNYRTQKEMSSMLEIFNSNRMKSAIFDKSINIARNYIGSQNTSVSYDEIDLIYEMQSNIQTLSSSSTINPNSQAFQQFINFIYPSFCNLANSTKLKIHENFNKSYDSIHQNQILIYSIQYLLFGLLIIVIFFFSHKFHQSMKAMMEIHCQFSESQMGVIKKYMNHLLVLFRKIGEEEHKTLANYRANRSSTKLSQIANIKLQSKQKEIQNVNLNKKVKKISLGKKLSEQRRSVYIKIGVGVAFLILVNLSNSIYQESFLEPIISLQIEGYSMIKDYPNSILSAHVVAKKYYSNLSGQPFDASLYGSVYDKIVLGKNRLYIGFTPDDSHFQAISKRYFFTNVCQFAPDLLLRQENMTITSCQAMANSSFKRGVTAFMDYQQKILKKVLKTNEDLLFQQVKDYMASVQVLNILSQEYLKSWTFQFESLIKETIFMSHTMTSFILALCVILLIIFEKYVLTNLRVNYRFYRNFYGDLMPDWIISEQKIIKSKLGVINFLPK